MSSPLLLASESPFRKNLMKQIGLDFQSSKPLIKEHLLKAQLDVEPTELAAALAKAKAESLIPHARHSIIIGCDQVLLLNGRPLDKPSTAKQVTQRLQELQGQTHQLYTALAVYHEGQWSCETVVAEMEMRALSLAQIEKYYELDQTIGCAGGYKIESRGPLLFKSIETSDYYSIIGLPLLSLIRILSDLGNAPL